MNPVARFPDCRAKPTRARTEISTRLRSMQLPGLEPAGEDLRELRVMLFFANEQ